MKHLNKFIECGVLLFVFLIPWQARWIIKGGELNGGYWEYGTVSLYATEVLLGLILAAIAVKGAIWFKRNRLRFDWQRLFSSSGVLLLLLVWSGLAVFWAIDEGAALQHWVFLALAASLFVIASPAFGVPKNSFGIFGVRLAGRSNPRIVRNGNVLSWVIITSAALQGAIALIQFFSQSIPGSTIFGMSAQSASTLGASVIETIDGRWLRAYGTFPHPNILGGWLALGLILLMRNLNRHSERSEESRGLTMRSFPRIKCGVRMTRAGLAMTKWAAFVVILTGLLVTFSRSAWLALILVIGYWLLVIGRRREQRIAVSKIIAIIVLTVALFAALFPEPFLARLSSSNRLEIKSSDERAASLSQSWQIIKKYPLTGVGLGNYGLAVHKHIDKTKPAWYYQPAHNVFLLIWSEIGLIGLLVVGLLVYWLFFSVIPAAFSPDAHREGIQLFYFLPLLSLSLFDHYLWSLYPGMMIGAVWLSLQRDES